jgi:hypothetical protein
MAQDPNQPFYWNFNPAPGYNASQDPAHWAAQNEYAMNKRNAQQEADEAAAEALLNQKQANLTTNTNNINNSFDSTFTPDFYSNYAKQLMSYWQPDLDQQHTDAQHQLNYTFADAQPGGGSAASDAFGRLQKAYDTAELQANDNSQSQANQLRSNVEGQRSALLSSVSGDTDPGAAVAQTQRTIGSIPLAPAYSPLGDVFSNLTGQFATAVQAARGSSVFGIPTTRQTSASGTGSEDVFNS